MRRDQVPADVERKDLAEAADTRLGRQMEDSVDAGEIERFLGQVAMQHVEPPSVLLFFGGVVVVGEAVHSDDVVAGLVQRMRKLRPDEPGGSGDDLSHREREVSRAV